MRSLFSRLLGFFSSLGLSCTLLVLLGILTWLGTLEQVDYGLFEVQKKYFESFYLVHQAGPLPIFLPGANLVLCLLFVNILLGGMVRLRRSWDTAGIFVTHIGIAFLLLAGFVKMYYSQDGHVTLFEGDRANYFQSYYRHELVVQRQLGDGLLREWVVPQEDFLDANDADPVRLVSSELPFDIELSNYMENCRPMPKGPMFSVDVPVVDGVFLRDQNLDPEAERNIAGAYVTVVDKQHDVRQQGILWGVDSGPLTVRVDGVDWGVDLRHERYPMPFTVELETFTKEDHPGISMAKAFSSDVTVIEGSVERPIKISMNEPLRDGGLVLYQASWGPANARPGDPLFSTLSVVRNPADQYPLYSCIIIAIGLLFHFGRKLVGYVQSQNKRADGDAADGARAGLRLMRKVAGVIAFATLSLFLSAPRAEAQESEGIVRRDRPWPDHVVELAQSLPIQEGGRIKPLDTFASFTMLRLNGKRSLTTLDDERLTPIEWLLDSLFYPEQATDYRSFIVNNSEVIEAIGLSHESRKKRDRYSFNELRPGVQRLFELAHEYSSIKDADRSSTQQQLVVLAENINSYFQLLGGVHTLALIPPTGSATDEPEWLTASDLFTIESREGTLPLEHAELLVSFEQLLNQREDLKEFEKQLGSVQAGIERLAEQRGEYGKIGMELTYYRLKLIPRSLYLFVLAFLAMSFIWLRPKARLPYGITVGAVSLGTVLLIGGITMRCIIRDRPPVSTLYETVIFVTAVALLVSLFLEFVNRQRIAISAAAILGMVGLFVANGYELLDKRDTMPSLVAVLDTNFWLATHVTCITTGYSAGMLAALLGSIYVVGKALRWKREDRAFYRSIHRMTYGVLCFALIFSIVGTILGGIWANDSWGRFWGWDPKENGALLIVISQIAILHARNGGFIRHLGLCMAAAFGGTIVAFSWWGVNLLGVGLHSYGFTSGVHTALWSYYWVQWSVVGLGAMTWWMERSQQPVTPPPG